MVSISLMGAILAMAVKIVPPTLIPCNAAERRYQPRPKAVGWMAQFGFAPAPSDGNPYSMM